MLFLKGAARELGFSLSGSHGSAAASLDFAISKQPQWVEDVFGVDKQGVSLLRRVVERSNSNLKRPGPVTVSLNRAALQENSITITVNGKDVSNILEIRALADDLALQLWGELPMQEDRARRLAA